MTFIRTGLLSFALLALSTGAHADVVQNDLVVAARTLGFLENAPTGELTVAVVYVSANAASVESANAVQKILSGGLKVGRITLVPVMVKLEDLQAAKPRIVFLADGVEPKDAAKVAEFSAARKVPCFTIDIEQVRQGACSVGVRSRPKVEILVNREAAADSGMKFASVFRMMITEF